MSDANNTQGSNEVGREAERRAIWTEVREYGREAGGGARGLVKTAATLVRAAHNGLLDTTKGADKKDDAERAYEMYKTAYSTKNEHGSVTQQASKMRAFIKMGMATSYNGVAVFSDTARIFDEMRKQDIKTKPEYQAHCAVANAQIKVDRALNEDEIKSLVVKSEAAEKDELDFFKAAEKALEKAYEMNPRDETEKLVNDLRAVFQMIVASFETSTLQKQIEEAQAKLAMLTGGKQ